MAVLQRGASTYRLRILNASNARVFQLSLAPEQPFFQIGSDGGLLSEPVTRNEVLIAPGERLDVVIDFRGREGRRIMLINTAPALPCRWRTDCPFSYTV